ncbi:hypothetical protein COO60DRAFT_1548902 [Scenedesmus sp. NREL 46B-D3]|nr:hypothetical protein COO60DRAFT_1548902 [Scenedesmus sp. NREL 46B-D3]
MVQLIWSWTQRCMKLGSQLVQPRLQQQQQQQQRQVQVRAGLLLAELVLLLLVRLRRMPKQQSSQQQRLLLTAWLPTVRLRMQQQAAGKGTAARLRQQLLLRLLLGQGTRQQTQQQVGHRLAGQPSGSGCRVVRGQGSSGSSTYSSSGDGTGWQGNHAAAGLSHCVMHYGCNGRAVRVCSKQQHFDVKRVCMACSMLG